MQNDTYYNPINVSDIHISLQPDEYLINGDLLKVSGYWNEKHQPILVYYHFKTEEEKNYFNNIEIPLTLKVSGKVSPIPGPTNENEFDFRQYMLGKGVSNEIQVEKCDYSSSLHRMNRLEQFNAFFHTLRKKMVDRLEKMPQPLGWFIQVLLLGYQSQNFQDTMDQINKLGLLYLFTLSGMHVFYLVSVIRYLMRKARITRETTNILLLIILPVYGIIGGGSLGLVRSILMSWLHIFSVSFSPWKLSGIECWSLVLLVNLYLRPAAVFSLAAQLSYLLTLILLLDRKNNQFLVGLKMGGYSIPVILWHTFTWNIWTIPLSIFIGPIFDWIIFPVVLGGAICPPLEMFCNKILLILQGSLGWGAGLPGTITFGKPPLFFVLFWLALMLIYEVTKFPRKLTAVLGISYLAVFSGLHFPLTSEVTYFDIGQGDCSLIRTRFDRQIILIDTGGKLSFASQKWQVKNSRTSGETVVVNYLHSKGIDHIDQMYLTHQDTDHVGNFPSISRGISVKQIIVPAGMEELTSFRQRLRLSGLTMKNVLPVTDRIKAGNDHILQVLHPFSSGAGKNEDSLVLLYHFYSLAVLFTGDLDQPNELKVMQKYPAIHADIMKTGHHGSKTASAPKFIEHLQPKLAIISAGKNNRYGHPNQETMITLKKFHVPYLLTARDGMIKVIRYPANQVKITKFVY